MDLAGLTNTAERKCLWFKDTLGKLNKERCHRGGAHERKLHNQLSHKVGRTSWPCWQNTLYADILLFLHKLHAMDSHKAIALHPLPQLINNIEHMFNNYIFTSYILAKDNATYNGRQNTPTSFSVPYNNLLLLNNNSLTNIKTIHDFLKAVYRVM